LPGKSARWRIERGVGVNLLGRRHRISGHFAGKSGWQRIPGHKEVQKSDLKGEKFINQREATSVRWGIRRGHVGHKKEKDFEVGGKKIIREGAGNRAKNYVSGKDVDAKEGRGSREEREL